MSYSFNAQRGLMIVSTELFGPSGSVILRLALDTGATGTMVNTALLVAVGYDPALAPDRIQITTGSGVEFTPRLAVDKIFALGQEQVNFMVLGHTLPPSASVDGLLGLDFFRGHKLTIDFQIGQVDLD
ncbi:MAG: retropepsin-like aspartic protease [Caldilineaceae bacterium]